MGASTSAVADARKLAQDATREGQKYLAAGDFAKARRAFDRAVGANSKWHPALGGLAEAAFNQGDYTFAVLSTTMERLVPSLTMLTCP